MDIFSCEKENKKETALLTEIKVCIKIVRSSNIKYYYL